MRRTHGNIQLRSDSRHHVDFSLQNLRRHFAHRKSKHDVAGAKDRIVHSAVQKGDAVAYELGKLRRDQMTRDVPRYVELIVYVHDVNERPRREAL